MMRRTKLIRRTKLLTVLLAVSIAALSAGGDASAKKKDRQYNAGFSEIDAAAASLMGRPTNEPGAGPSPGDKGYWRSQKKLEDMYLDRAKKLAEKKNYSDALSIIRSAIIKFGYDADLHKAEDNYSIELANREISDDAAIKILDGVLEWDPKNELATRVLTVRLRNKGIDIGSFDQRVAYARQLLAEGDQETAIREFQAALHIKYDPQISQLVAQLRTQPQRLQPPSGQNY